MEAKEKIFQQLKLFLDNKDVGMTKDQYLDMMDQMNQEPDWERCPPAWEDFPNWVIDGINVYHSLGSRIYPDVGFIGKDYTNFKFLLDQWGLNKELTFEICTFMEARDIEASQKKLKAEYDRIKRRGKNNSNI